MAKKKKEKKKKKGNFLELLIQSCRSDPSEVEVTRAGEGGKGREEKSVT